MVNRLPAPTHQFCDETGAPYALGKLYFYATNSSTPLDTYTTDELNIANDNPLTLDSAGRCGAVFLQELEYKVVLKDADGDEIWTMDPVSVDFSTRARLLTYAGNPNGNVAGTAGSATTLADMIWDRNNNVMYICTTTGDAASAVWTTADASGGTTAFTSDLSPTQITASQNNYNPSGLSSSTVLRLDLSAAWALTGLAGGADGRIIIIYNISAFTLTLTNQSGSSDVNKRFVCPDGIDFKVAPTAAIVLQYDSTASRWRVLSPTPSFNVARFWAYVTVAAGTPTLAASANVTSITDTGVGLLTVTIATDFATTSWATFVSIELADTGIDALDDALQVTYQTKAVGSVDAHVFDQTTAFPTDRDPASYSVMGMGDQV